MKRNPTDMPDLAGWVARRLPTTVDKVRPLTVSVGRVGAARACSVVAAVDGTNDIAVSADVPSARLFYVALHLEKGTE